MPLYMTQAGYTSEAWAALTHNPEDRSEVFGRLAESMGGRLVSFYNSFGEYDLLVIYEAPTRAPPRPLSWLPSPLAISVGSRPPCC